MTQTDDILFALTKLHQLPDCGLEEGDIAEVRREGVKILEEGKAIRAAAQDAPEDHNLARGVIKGMSYLGDITLYEIKLDNGAMIRVSRPNLSRHDQDAFTWDDRVSMHWRADSPVVLLS